MVKLKCKRCDREWEYKGQGKFYTSCPICKSSVKIKIKGDLNERKE